MRLVSLFLLLMSISALADVTGAGGQTKTPEDERAKIEEYKEACQINDALLVRKQFQVSCFSNFHYYGPTAIGARPLTGQVRIAGYNLLHPGTSKALFKDYSLVAKIMNQYDVVGGLELLGTVGHDRANNDAVVALLRASPKMVEELKALRAKTTAPKKIKEIDDRLAKLIADTKTAYSLYRAPGYFKILMALKKLDPSWGLILSPRGDSALQDSVEELVGFFFRANTVSPVVNPHCNEYRDQNAGTTYACIINIGAGFMGKDHTQNFSRRPFLASFRSGSLNFSLVSMHVVYTYSGDEVEAKRLMNEVFGVDSPSQLGTGINSTNFARFAELKLTLDFMNRYRNKYYDKNIMMVSDTNITADNAFWPTILKSFPGGTRLIDEETTISPSRYDSEGKETGGTASSYDHFILDKAAFPGCDNGHVYNYYKSDIQNDIERIYMIGNRTNLYSNRLMNKNFSAFLGDQTAWDGDVPPDEEDPLPINQDYPMTPAGQIKFANTTNAYLTYLQSLQTVSGADVVADDFQVRERIEAFKRRVFMNQLTNAYYYRFYQEILSDHFPISINCRN